MFSDPKIDKIKKIWLKKNLFKIPSCYFSLKIQMRIKYANKSFITFFFVQLTECTFETYCKKKISKKVKIHCSNHF
jgi:hypothetical protein